MVQIHNLGFPRIGKQRELKFELERFWSAQSSAEQLTLQAQQLAVQNWRYQSACDWLPVGDFSLYDHVLDMSFLLGHLPKRVAKAPGSLLDKYFRLARGRSANDSHCQCVNAAEMTKWFDTNYHYIVPEIDNDTVFELNPTQLLSQIAQAKQHHANIKPVIIGPVTYLWLSKSKGKCSRLDYLAPLLDVYKQLLSVLEREQVQWLQIDEPILVTELDSDWQQALSTAYQALSSSQVKLLLTTYFGRLQDNLPLACQLPVDGLHLDAVSAENEVAEVISALPKHKVLSLGVVNGRNIWKSDLSQLLNWLEPIAEQLGDKLWLAPSCSLLHVPVDVSSEQHMDPQIQQWLAFAVQKLDELQVLKKALNHGRAAVKQELENNAKAVDSRRCSKRVHSSEVKQAVAAITTEMAKRQSPYALRAKCQRETLKLPLYPTTTIGSFPQTGQIRKTRLQFKKGELDQQAYVQQMRSQIQHCVREQEALGLDVLVHGEAERNDMVEYFGEQLEGYVISQHGWVQSYGSRCVKPPILFGDISRPAPMTVDWIQYAQSLTDKPVKGMLTGPVTILNWSFVRDDQPRRATCYQLALAIRDEVLALEEAGVHIIQIDEAALREGLPLRRNEWADYLDWAVEAFRISANGVQDQTQIHTHMCYSEFNDIIKAIANMDADVITIETSRSDMELLDVFEQFSYPNEIGPGVYDIHSPNIPDTEQIIALIKRAQKRIDPEKLWINPDCGLKTRQWQEVIPALRNMIKAAAVLRAEQPTVA